MSYWSPDEPRNAHLLVVDDNVDELQLLLELLRGTGYRITLAFDALEGYRRATALKVDLVLLDVRMGAVDGYAACRLLKADPDAADIPVIFVTSSATPEERLMGLKSGAVDYIVKPFDPAEVLARVEIHLALAERRKLQAGEAGIGFRPEAGERADESVDMDRARVQAVERLVLSHLKKVPSLPELAVQVGTHQKRLSRVFREHTGRTVFEFVREARLHEAQRLLAKSFLRIDEIAAELGFSSAANFATAFREHFGWTPSAFRRLSAAGAASASEHKS